MLFQFICIILPFSFFKCFLHVSIFFSNFSFSAMVHGYIMVQTFNFQLANFADVDNHWRYYKNETLLPFTVHNVFLQVIVTNGSLS